MSKPIWYVRIKFKYRKTIFVFEFPTIANNKDEITDFDKYFIAKKAVGSSKNLCNKYLKIFTDCIITDFKIIKQIGQTSK